MSNGGNEKIYANNIKNTITNNVVLKVLLHGPLKIVN